MKIALDWIAEYLTRPVNAAEAEGALIGAGLPLESVEEMGATTVLDVEVTSNRTDCLSHIGVARELAALLEGVEFKMPGIAVRALGGDVRGMAKVRVEDGVGCPYYSARVIEGVKVGPSPEWMVRRLESIGLRSVNNVVDITNYVLMETGQPLHAFDMDLLGGREIVVRRARVVNGAGEKMVAIDGKTYELAASMLVIADAQKPAAIAGVMGGKETEVTERTRTILLESARFDPVTIRAQGRALGLKSDSSFRFERGIDPAAAERASLRAAQLMHELCGGTVAAGVIVVGSAEVKGKVVEMRVERVKKVLGYEVPVEAMVGILGRLGFSPVVGGGVIKCVVPSHRLDIEREIDLIEEVARVWGYEKIPLLAEVTHGVAPEPVREKARRAILETMMAAGVSEAITVTFVDEAEAKLFLPAGAREGAKAVRVSDAVRKASNVLRPSLLASLLAVRRTNQNAGEARACVFEHGAAVWEVAGGIVEMKMLALVGNSVSEVRGVLEQLAYRLSAEAVLSVEPRDEGWYAKGVAGDVVLTVGRKRNVIGSIGLFSDAVQKQFDLRHEVAGAEVAWEGLIGAFEPVRRAKELSKYPGVRRDLSVVVEDKVRWSAISAAIVGAKLPFMEKVDFVGTFRNKQIGEGKKSLTLTLEFRDPAGTLKSEQVDEQMKGAVEVLGRSVGAVMRG